MSSAALARLRPGALIGALPLAALLAACLLAACASSPPPAAVTSLTAPLPPSTARDPLPFTPPPSDRPAAGEPTALAVRGGDEQARAVARRVLRAVDRGELEVLESLLAPELFRLSPRAHLGLPRISRSSLLEALREAWRAHLPPIEEGSERPAGAEDRDGTLAQLPVASIATFFPREHIPVGLQSDDRIVQVILGEGGRSALLRAVFGWRYRGLIVIRAGSRPRVVGL